MRTGRPIEFEMPTMAAAEPSATAADGTVNGIDVPALRGAIDEITRDPAKGAVGFEVTTTWKGGTQAETRVEGYEIGGARVARSFRFTSDEPLELCGGNAFPNPQEYLMGALNSCMTVGYVAGAALRGIRLRELSIETSGSLDLRGFLGIDASVAPGYTSIRCRVRIAADATEAQLREIHETVMRTSPNVFNVTRPVPIDGELIVG